MTCHKFWNWGLNQTLPTLSAENWQAQIQVWMFGVPGSIGRAHFLCLVLFIIFLPFCSRLKLSHCHILVSNSSHPHTCNCLVLFWSQCYGLFCPWPRTAFLDTEFQRQVNTKFKKNTCNFKTRFQYLPVTSCSEQNTPISASSHQIFCVDTSSNVWKSVENWVYVQALKFNFLACCWWAQARLNLKNILTFRDFSDRTEL